MGKYIEKYTDFEVKEWYNEYLKCKSVYSVSSVFNVSSATIWRRIKEYEKLNNINNLTPFKYTSNDNFFSQNTPESFYWAGFIAADGCINKHGKKLSIGLSYKDKELLEKFKKCINYTGPIRFKEDKIGRGGKTNYIDIFNKQIINDLARFNIVPRKSLTLTFPEWLIEHELVNHFMRGYFDGDGCIYRMKNNYPYFMVYGTEKFLIEYKKILVENCKLNDNKIHKLPSIYSLNYGGYENVEKVRNFIYNNVTEDMVLDRKYKKFFKDKL